VGWHRTGPGLRSTGNILVSGDTVDALAETFEASTSKPLAERLLDCLDAAQAAGGDRRGQQSAAILVVGPGQGYAGLSTASSISRGRPPPASRGAPAPVRDPAGAVRADAAVEWITVDDGLRKEIDDRLAVLGYESLDEWAGVENLEMRVDGTDSIDPVVLERLRERSA
jgi:uncharacterized Ntn-hydrolase superfamily protein